MIEQGAPEAHAEDRQNTGPRTKGRQIIQTEQIRIADRRTDVDIQKSQIQRREQEQIPKGNQINQNKGESHNKARKSEVEKQSKSQRNGDIDATKVSYEHPLTDGQKGQRNIAQEAERAWRVLMEVREGCFSEVSSTYAADLRISSSTEGRRRQMELRRGLPETDEAPARVAGSDTEVGKLSEQN